MNAPDWDVIVVGGGLAGIGAALRLAEAGRRVLLLETRKKLGGRATSFIDVRTGESLDNCQHVAMGCCVNYLDLCSRLGVSGSLAWTREIHWVETGGRISTMRPGLFPAPAHFTKSMLGAKFLTLGEKTAIARAMLAILRGPPRGPALTMSPERERRVGSGATSPERERRDRTTFGVWLRAHRQPASAIDKFWSPIIISACNIGVERADAALAIKVFRDGFLATRRSADIAVAAVPLVELYDPAEGVLARAGGEIRLGVSADRLDASSVTLARAAGDGETIRAGRVICAVPPERAAKIIDPALFAMDPRFEPLARIEHSPILGVHLTFDRPVMRLPHATLVGRATQWVFNKGVDDVNRARSSLSPRERMSPLGATGEGDGDGSEGVCAQRLHAVISAADDWMDLSEEQIGARVMEDIRACFPRAFEGRGLDGSGPASLTRVRAVKEKRATFAATPETEARRPATTGPSGVILAGDYVATGWPATMEGAVRSGYLAASAALGADLSTALVPDLTPGTLVRALSSA